MKMWSMVADTLLFLLLSDITDDMSDEMSDWL